MKPKRKGFWTSSDYSFCNVEDCFLKKNCKRHISNYIWNGNEVYTILLAPAHSKYMCDMYWEVGN
jgi:hypothetical protein